MSTPSRLQRRIQRYGWDLAASDYERCWRSQLQPLRAALLNQLAIVPAAKVLDVACGSGELTLEVALRLAGDGVITGVDVSEQMIVMAKQLARRSFARNMRFERMDAEQLVFADNSFDTVMCSLGLMYSPDALLALKEMHRVLVPGGQMVFAVWGQREACGWSGIFDIIQEEVTSEVCPMFFSLGSHAAATEVCAQACLQIASISRLVTTLHYEDGITAANAATLGGPAALAWSRFDETTRSRVKRRYLASLAPWKSASGYAVPAEFLIASAVRQDTPQS